MVAASPALAVEKNIALGRPYVLDSTPRYSQSTESGDAVQLTDGQYAPSTETMWTLPLTVGWQSVIPVIFTIDLGEVQPISGASFNTAAWSPAGVNWPFGIFVLVSNDQKVWRQAGDLVKLSHQAGRVQPPAEKGGNFRFQTDQLKTRGRYVRFVAVPNGMFAFCDEVEVYRGPDSLLAGSITGPIVKDATQLARIAATNAGIDRRLEGDLAAVRGRLAKSRLPQDQKKVLAARLDAVEQGIVNLPDADPDTFRTVFPMNDSQAEILAVNGLLLGGEGLTALSASKMDRYAYVAPFDAFQSDGGATDEPALSIEMMGNEFRADSLLLTNASEKPIAAKIRLRSLPGGPWTDTAAGVPTAAALPTTNNVGGVYSVVLPAGLTSKVWFAVDSSKLEPGDYQGSLLIESAEKPIDVRFHLRVSAVRMNQPRLSLGMWDSSNDGRYGKNTEQAIRMMDSHFLDTPWANLDVIPWPSADYFDESGKLIKPMKFDALNQWIKQRPNARRYYVFANVSDEFAGMKAGTEQFNVRVAAWARALAEHMISRGLKPEQLGLMLVDEPGTDEQMRRVLHWAAAIRQASPRPIMYQDFDFVQGDNTRGPDYLKLAHDVATSVDAISPQFILYHRGEQAAVDYFEELRRNGCRFGFYQCMGPVKTYSPLVYYRLLSWQAFIHHAEELGFWAFYDKGNAISSWNEYDSSARQYTPVFIDPKGITSGIHWEAVREGIEDHEYLAMLQDAADRTADARLKSEAGALIKSITNGLTQRYVDDYAWSDTNANRFQPDGYRVQALRLLEKFQKDAEVSRKG
jgi:hypothetical protein